MNPSRASIYDAIERLRGLEGSPSMFQRLAEAYAQRMFPRLFPSLEPRGINPQGIAVRGWPDAFAICPDGRIQAMEATMARRWTRHLRDDLDHLRDEEPGRFAGMLFVIWAPAPEPDELNDWSEKVVKLGVPADSVTFVFQERLARDLCQPRFAAVWADLLRLPSTCYPFQRISEVAGIFGTEGSTEVFAPTLREYQDDSVHRPALLAPVAERLGRRGWAWVRGRGATGKTVLAARLALDHESHAGPAYYLDLAAVDTEGRVATTELFDVLSTRADSDVLFVVDNVHLAPELASALFKHWREAGQGSRWLMLGRLRELGTHPRGVARPLQELRPSALELENTEEDLRGVYLRLVRRRASAASEPPREVLRRWKELFAADLIAFSAAIIRRLSDLVRGRWSLEAADARAYVRDRYLGGSEEERQNLLRLAAMTAIELATPEEALEVRALEKGLQRGYVLRSEHGREHNRRYRLVHPGLGELLLASIVPTVDPLELLAFVASGSLFTTSLIAVRMEELGRPENSVAILQEVVKEPKQLFGLLTQHGLFYAASWSQRLVRLGVRTALELDEVVAQDSGRLTRTAFRKPLHFLASFLSYAERALPEAHKILAAELQKPDNVGQLAEAALTTPLNALASFLSYAERGLPEAHKTFATELQKPENVGQLAEAGLRTPLNDLTSFLSYAERGLPEAHKNLAAELQKPDNVGQLAEAALRTPPALLASFLSYAERALPKTHETLAMELQKPDNVGQLADAALRTPLNDLASFLTYVERALPEIHEILAAKLQRPESVGHLAEAALRAPLNDLAAFLSLPDLGAAVLADISGEKWREVRSAKAATTREVVAFLPFARAANHLNRRDLAEVTAHWILTTAVAQHLPKNFYLRDLSLILSHAPRVDPSAAHKFAKRATTPSRLRSTYADAHSGTIAGTLFSLWWYHPPLIRLFHHPALPGRLRHELAKMHWYLDEWLGSALRLLGVADLIRMPLPDLRVRWPGRGNLLSAVDALQPPPEMESIGTVHVQLWLGLRTMARLRRDRVKVPHEHAERILELWREGETETDRQRAFNEWMIAWLEGCAKAGWTLVSDQDRFENSAANA